MIRHVSEHLKPYINLYCIVAALPALRRNKPKKGHSLELALAPGADEHRDGAHRPRDALVDLVGVRRADSPAARALHVDAARALLHARI